MDGLGNACDPVVDVCGAVGALDDDVVALGLPGGLRNSFLVKLENALNAYENGNYQAAIGQLGAFANQAAALSGTKIPEPDASDWIERAQAISDAISEGETNCVPGDGSGGSLSVPGRLGGQVAESPLALSLFPNPVSSMVTVRFPEVKEDAVLSILDKTGRITWQRSLRAGDVEVQLEVSGGNFPAGLYLVNLRTAENSVVKKLIVQKP